MPHSRTQFTLLLLLFVLILSCGSNPLQVLIKGTIEGAPNTLVLLRHPLDNTIVTQDSAYCNKRGEFEMRVEVNTPSFFMLQVDGEAEPIVLLVEPNDEIELWAQKGNLAGSYRVKGSGGSILVQQLNTRLNHTVAQIDSLSHQFKSSLNEPNFHQIKYALDSSYAELIGNHREFTIRFVKENRYSLAAVLALYQQYDPTRSVLNRREDFQLFQLVDSSLYPLYSQNPLVANLHTNVRKMEAQLRLYDKRNDMFEVGERLPNVQLPLVTGDTIALWSLKKRYVLVDFWASWCDECQQANKHYKELYQRHAQEGFEIIQVAIDENREQLLKTLMNDSIPWLVASDFLQWDSPLLDSLSINSIPSNYLMDRNGKILQRNISKEGLEKVLGGR